jgi:hypothetical protein
LNFLNQVDSFVTQWARAYDPLGEVDVALLSGGLGASIAAGDTEHRPGAVLGEFGARFAAGYGHANGSAFDPATRASTLDGLVEEVSLLARLGIIAVYGLRLLGELELGGVVRGLDVRADTRPVGGIGGALWAITVGVGYDW